MPEMWPSICDVVTGLRHRTCWVGRQLELYLFSLVGQRGSEVESGLLERGRTPESPGGGVSKPPPWTKVQFNSVLNLLRDKRQHVGEGVSRLG